MHLNWVIGRMHQLMLEQSKMKPTHSLKFKCGSGGIKPMAHCSKGWTHIQVVKYPPLKIASLKLQKLTNGMKISGRIKPSGMNN